jgi:hypothetical protein
MRTIKELKQTKEIKVKRVKKYFEPKFDCYQYIKDKNLIIINEDDNEIEVIDSNNCKNFIIKPKFSYFNDTIEIDGVIHVKSKGYYFVDDKTKQQLWGNDIKANDLILDNNKNILGFNVFVNNTLFVSYLFS